MLVCTSAGNLSYKFEQFIGSKWLGKRECRPEEFGCLEVTGTAIFPAS